MVRLNHVLDSLEHSLSLVLFLVKLDQFNLVVVRILLLQNLSFLYFLQKKMIKGRGYLDSQLSFSFLLQVLLLQSLQLVLQTDVVDFLTL